MDIETIYKNKLYRGFFIVLYDDMTFFDKFNVQNCLTWLSHAFDKFAFIKHEYDIKEDGKPDKPHYHIYIYSNCPHTIQSVSKTYDIPLNLFSIRYNKNKNPIEPDRKSCIRYLIHKDNKDKYPYNINDIVYNGIDILSILQDKDITISELIEYCIHENSLHKRMMYAIEHNMLNEYNRYYNIINDMIKQMQRNSLNDGFKPIDYDCYIPFDKIQEQIYYK